MKIKNIVNEFAPGGNSSSSYYAVTANFVNEFAQQKQEEIQDLIDAGWTKQDLAQAGTQEAAAADIAHLEQVRDGFLKGLKPGFDAYLQGDTQMKDQLGEYWLDNDLPLNQDWEKIYGEPWGDDGEFDESVAEAMGEHEFKSANGPVSVTTEPGRTVVKRKEWDNSGSGSDSDSGTLNAPALGGTRKSDYDSGDYSDERSMDEAEQQKGADYRDPPEADYGDDYQAMVKRMKQLAGAGPLKTVYDPNKRVYKNMPTATQPGAKK